jgi:hypothetical protein
MAPEEVVGAPTVATCWALGGTMVLVASAVALEYLQPSLDGAYGALQGLDLPLGMNIHVSSGYRRVSLPLSLSLAPSLCVSLSCSMGL